MWPSRCVEASRATICCILLRLQALWSKEWLLVGRWASGSRWSWAFSPLWALNGCRLWGGGQESHPHDSPRSYRAGCWAGGALHLDGVLGDHWGGLATCRHG